jgi:hypothetical protein
MEIDVKKIFNAWATSFNPSQEEKELSEKRYEVCLGCDQRAKKLAVEYCKACGCPLSKKVFSLAAKSSCPLGKWDELDKEFNKNKKKKLTLF